MPNDERGFDGLDFSTVWLQALERVTSDADGRPAVATLPYGSRRAFVLWPNDPARRMHVYSHNIGVNSTMTEGLCRDKKLTHSVLSTAGIPVVPHFLCMGSQRFGRFPPRSSQWLAALEFFHKHAGDVVAKPTSGCSGDRVFRVRTPEALEAAVCALDSLPSFVLTPFVASTEEVRVMIVPELQRSRVGRRAAFILRKTALAVTGDGRRTLEELLLDPATPFPAGADRAAIAADLASSTPGLALETVVPAGEVVRSWKYNESKGAAFTAVHAWEGDAALEGAVRVALAAAAALGLRFGAVDVLLPSCTILEVNTDVMLDVLELPDASVDALLREMLACRAALAEACAEGPREADEEAAASSPPGALQSSPLDIARPTSFAEKAGLKLRSLRAIAGSLGVRHVAALDHEYLVILAEGGAVGAEGADAGALDLSRRRVFNTNYDFGLTMAFRCVGTDDAAMQLRSRSCLALAAETSPLARL